MIYKKEKTSQNKINKIYVKVNGVQTEVRQVYVKTDEGQKPIIVGIDNFQYFIQNTKDVSNQDDKKALYNSFEISHSNNGGTYVTTFKLKADNQLIDNKTKKYELDFHVHYFFKDFYLKAGDTISFTQRISALVNNGKTPLYFKDSGYGDIKVDDTTNKNETIIEKRTTDVNIITTTYKKTITNNCKLQYIATSNILNRLLSGSYLGNVQTSTIYENNEGLEIKVELLTIQVNKKNMSANDLILYDQLVTVGDYNGTI